MIAGFSKYLLARFRLHSPRLTTLSHLVCLDEEMRFDHENTHAHEELTIIEVTSGNFTSIMDQQFLA
jgi:hypothetical protein